MIGAKTAAAAVNRNARFRIRNKSLVAVEQHFRCRKSSVASPTISTSTAMPRSDGTTIIPKLCVYHGELIGKTEYVKAFLRQREKVKEHNYDKISMVLDTIVSRCVSMRDAVLDGELEDELSSD